MSWRWSKRPPARRPCLAASRHHVDLLVADYLLPGITGVELMHKIRARNPGCESHPDQRAVTSARRVNEMLNAGAVAVFDKPIPAGRFSGRGGAQPGPDADHLPPRNRRPRPWQSRAASQNCWRTSGRTSDADAVFLLNDRGRVLARAGDLYDSSMEVSLLSSLMAIYSCRAESCPRFIHQEQLDNFPCLSAAGIMT